MHTDKIIMGGITNMVKEYGSTCTSRCTVDQLDGQGRTAAQVAATFVKHDVAALLQGLGV
jgi:hypothetical protein